MRQEPHPPATPRRASSPFTSPSARRNRDPPSKRVNDRPFRPGSRGEPGLTNGLEAEEQTRARGVRLALRRVVVAHERHVQARRDDELRARELPLAEEARPVLDDDRL